MTPVNEPPKDLKEIKARFITLLGELTFFLEMSSQKVDIRDRIAALSLIDKVLAREKDDDDAERAGSKVKQYAPTFAQAARNGPGGDRTGTPNRDGVGSDPADYDPDTSPDGGDAH